MKIGNKTRTKAMKNIIALIKDYLGLNGKRDGFLGINYWKDKKKEGHLGLLISELTGKLEGMHSASTATELSEFCRKMAQIKGSICSHCFARRATVSNDENDPEHVRYQGLQKALRHNYEWMNEEHTIEEFPMLNDIYFRIQSHGDCDTVIQCKNFIRLCLRNPETNFSAWTKNVIAWDKAFAELGKPANLIMIYSAPMLNREVKLEDIKRCCPWVDKVFTVYELEYLAENQELVPTINCGAKQCLACKLCYRMDNGVTQIREVMK